jgi:hypothetical protein
MCYLAEFQTFLILFATGNTFGHEVLKMLYGSLVEKRYHSWISHYALRREVAGSIPDDAIHFFNQSNPSNIVVALGLTKSLTEISTRNLHG